MSHTKRRLSRNSKATITKQAKIVLTFIEMLNTVKLYHWKTHSFATHKATDELYADLNSNIDKFVETMLGHSASDPINNRVNLSHVKSIPLCDYNSVNDYIKRIKQYIAFLNGLSLAHLTDLMTVRDELLINMNKFLYLMTFK
jgi:DNA-binding ferritin-like protein